MASHAAVPSNWFETFFDRAANDFWAAAVPSELTEAETEFLRTVLHLSAQSSVLDIAAGRGRLALPIADLVHDVTALELSSDGTRHLRDQTAGRSNIDVVQGDMRAIPLRRRFHASYCMGNSFGYFDEAGVLQSLSEAARVLVPGGRFVLESASVAELLLADLAEETHHVFGGVDIVGHHHHDAEHQVLVSTLVVDDGTTRSRRVMQQLVLTADEICGLLEGVGLKVVGRYGGPDGRAFGADAGSLLVVAEVGESGPASALEPDPDR